MQARLGEWWDRIRNHSLIIHQDPLVLRTGAHLFLHATSGPVTASGRMFILTSGLDIRDSNSWVRPGPGVVGTRRLPPGKPSLQGVAFDDAGHPWFSPVIQESLVAGKTNDFAVAFSRGVTVRGTLDPSVPRPVSQGRVMAQVWPAGFRPEDSPPSWHSWSPVKPDGSFELAGMPPGDLEVVALCDGFVSTNGPGKFSVRYPQRHVLGREDLSIVIGMEPTSRVFARVLDERGNPVRGARVVAWPNARYGEWAAVILASDRYTTASLLLSESEDSNWWGSPVPDFEGVSDEQGLAVIPNLPATTDRLGVQHPQFGLPAIGTPATGMNREARISLVAGDSNRITLHLEPKGSAPVTHY